MVSDDLLTEPVTRNQRTNGKICGRKWPCQEVAIKPAKLAVKQPYFQFCGVQHTNDTNQSTFLKFAIPKCLTHI